MHQITRLILGFMLFLCGCSLSQQSRTAVFEPHTLPVTAVRWLESNLTRPFNLATCCTKCQGLSARSPPTVCNACRFENGKCDIGIADHSVEAGDDEETIAPYIDKGEIARILGNRVGETHHVIFQV